MTNLTVVAASTVACLIACVVGCSASAEGTKKAGDSVEIQSTLDGPSGRTSAVDGFPTRQQLEALKFHVPRNGPETADAIGSLIVRAPDYTNKFFPKYTIEVGYGMAMLGLEAVDREVTTPQQRNLVVRCREELLLAYAAFKRGNDEEGFRLVQKADQTFAALGFAHDTVIVD